ncbi:hypothetical protein [Bradyrhizobium sp. URHD0069]|uniref:hypothetical protein n=1 Tax=Bradyrhizobium sp. URHD0069 TaxID=1380355 RepID=UPI0004971E35|nr:hypothetical protein [Bradyrhizobium sp. URHD0069]
MRKLLGTFVMAALLIGRTALAETVGLANGANISGSTGDASSASRELRLAMPAPVGHRQPQARDISSESPGDIERLGDEDRVVDRKLTICRGC